MGIELAVAGTLANIQASKEQKKAAKQQMNQQQKIYNEQKKAAEDEKIEQEKKNKKIKDTYDNMQTNLTTGGITGISSNQLLNQ